MLKECIACKNQISVNAKKCPKCGQPQTSESQKAIVILIIVAFIIYAVSKAILKKENKNDTNSTIH